MLKMILSYPALLLSAMAGLGYTDTSTQKMIYPTSYETPLLSMTKVPKPSAVQDQTPVAAHAGKYVLIHLDRNNLELRDGDVTLATINLVTQGKPGSYYETIGGSYVSDYKELSHFSSIGHVFMPYSVHLFGNYFIHGIPYHADGTQVSSTYSGGCIRLANYDAKTVYDFVEKGMPIILTRGNEYDFAPTRPSTIKEENTEMTRLMAATISLDALTQENKIQDADGNVTTRKELLPQLLLGDDSVSTVYASALGEKTFTKYMNDKALALGLTNTRFDGVTNPAVTSSEDEERFMNYITTYKSYLLTPSMLAASPLTYR
jgi:hypothetical protein